jgi:hypothetical protein
MHHGIKWLIDPTKIGNGSGNGNGVSAQQQQQQQTCNHFINQIIKGNEASSVLEAMHASQNNDNDDVTTTTTTIQERRQKHHDFSTLATQGASLHGFLER